jgi:hypothetical protein
MPGTSEGLLSYRKTNMVFHVRHHLRYHINRYRTKDKLELKRLFGLVGIEADLLYKELRHRDQNE